jgi:hypothetical protein
MHKAILNRHSIRMQKESTWWIWLVMAVVIVLDIAEVIISRFLINP